MSKPSELYAQKVASSNIMYNQPQQMVVKNLDLLYQQIIAESKFNQILKLFGFKKTIKGIYLWGGVGRGKTFLVDLFYDCLPHNLVLRIHFHRFMQTVHTLLTKFQGHVDPLEDVAKDFMQYKVLIFDEFYVLDITDAMLLGTLLQKLFKKGMILVATSNTHPDMLYSNGLQRTKFLPAIAAINKYCQVICLDSEIDFRTRALTTMDIFHYPINKQTDNILEQTFHKLSPNAKFIVNHSIDINDRLIQTKMYADNICETPRSPADYIQLSKLYDAIVISNVPVFDYHNQDGARRFIELIDELYDRKVKIIMSCAAEIQNLFIEGANKLAFQRTISRLIEMRSQEYMGLARIK
jgi:cell division protein ZapE